MAGQGTVEAADRRVPVPGGEIHAVEWGAGRESGLPLILLHGITANARVWDPVAARLARRWRPVAIDQRGHGTTKMQSGGHEAKDYVGDVFALIEALGLGKVVLVGHSLGARNVLEAGAAGHDAVAAVVAIDFTPFIEEEKFDALDARVGAGDTAFDDLDAVKRYLAGRYPNMPADAVGRRAVHGYRSDGDGRLRPRADPAAMTATCKGLRADLAPAVRAIGVPTLLVRGADSAFVSADAFARTRALRPDLEAVVVDGADHYVPEVKPAETAALIERFVGALDPARLS